MKLKKIAIGSFLFLLTACDVSFCGPVGGPQGGAGQTCRTDGRSPCDPGLTCGGWNHCEACGGHGQLCCPDLTGPFGGCGGGEHCSQAHCAVCGEPGQQVCQQAGVFVGGMCLDGGSVGPGFICVAGSTPPTSGPCSGSSLFPVGCITSTGCFEPVSVPGDTLDDAKACAQSMPALDCFTTTDDIGTPRAVCVKISTVTDRTVSETATSDELAVSCALAATGGLSAAINACADGR